jgi:predicted TIM-barrel fold metal-dependent hydrolase
MKDNSIILKELNRRKFVTNTVASAAGLLLGTNLAKSYSGKNPPIYLENTNRRDLMKEVMKYRKIDSHAHVYFSPDSPGTQIDFADRLVIKTLIISRPMEPGSKGLPEEFKKCNDLVLKCLKQHPDRFIGQMTLNPAYPKESQEEIKRCVDNGMVGSKFYNHVKINDPLFYPVIEKFIALKMILLMHTPIGKSRVKLNTEEPPNISLPEDFVDIAKRYPEAMFQFAHIGGGIDWEDACKALAHSPNVFVDVSGSNNEATMIEFALKYIGEDRLLFGCDNSFYQGVGHVLADDLTELQRKKIFFENYNTILKKSGKNVD